MIDTKNLKVVFFGTPNFVIPVLEILFKNFNLIGVVTSADKPVGRSQILTASPIKQSTLSMSYNIRIITPEIMGDDLIDYLNDLKPDLGLVAAFGQIISPHALSVPKYGFLNIHPSILPKFRGASPLQATILSGYQETGISIIQMDQDIDHGPIIYSKKFKLSEQETFETLSNKSFKLAAQVLPKVISDYISGKIKPKEQNHQTAIFTKLLRKKDGYFDINNPPNPQQLNRIIRAYYPWPTTWTKWNNKVVKFYPNSIVQLEGKTKVKLEEFLKGYPNFPIKSL